MAKLPLRALGFSLLLVGGAQAGEVAAPTVAKIIKIVCNSTAKTKVACQDPELAAELGKLGIGMDPDAKIVWALDDKDVAKYAQLNKLVISGKLSHIAQGSSIVIVAEGGRPSIYLGPANIAAANISLPDALLKIGKVAK